MLVPERQPPAAQRPKLFGFWIALCITLRHHPRLLRSPLPPAGGCPLLLHRPGCPSAPCPGGSEPGTPRAAAPGGTAGRKGPGCRTDGRSVVKGKFPGNKRGCTQWVPQPRAAVAPCSTHGAPPTALISAPLTARLSARAACNHHYQLDATALVSSPANEPNGSLLSVLFRSKDSSNTALCTQSEYDLVLCSAGTQL